MSAEKKYHIKQLKKAQAKKRETVGDTKDSEWLPIPPVTIDTDDPFKSNCKYKHIINLFIIQFV